MTIDPRDPLLDRKTRRRLVERVRADLQAVGLDAEVEVIGEEASPIRADVPYRVVGSHGAGSISTVGVVLKPSDGHPATAGEWSKTATGEWVARRAAAQVVPAHFGIRILYAVLDPSGSWRPVDPPRIGLSRIGKTLEGSMKPRKPADADAMVLELIADVAELFGVEIDPDLNPAAYDEFVIRNRRRHQRLYGDGQFFGEGLVNNQENRIAALERTIASLMRRSGPQRVRNGGDIPLNP